jgi:hypothetical protein
MAYAADPSPCNTRVPPQAAFPPVVAQSQVLTPQTLKALAGNKGWGIEEDVTIEAPGDEPGRIVIAVRLPKGSIDHKNTDAPMGGMGFRWQAGIPASATMACLTYHVKLPADFQFNKGGKLPGLFGGDGPAGGKDVDGASGFSARLMWRQDGAGEVYAYIPGKPDGRGLSIDRGAWTFPRGRWVELQEEIVLNALAMASCVSGSMAPSNSTVAVCSFGQLPRSALPVSWRTFSMVARPSNGQRRPMRLFDSRPSNLAGSSVSI